MSCNNGTCPACGNPCKHWHGWNGANPEPQEYSCDHCKFGWSELDTCQMTGRYIKLSEAVAAHKGQCSYMRIVPEIPRFSIAAVRCKKRGKHWRDGHWYCRWHTEAANK